MDKKRIVTTVGATALVVLIISSYFITSGKSRVNVKTDRISIKEIKKGAFQKFMRGDGNLNCLNFSMLIF